MSDGVALFYRFEVCSRDVFLSHICRNQRYCDKLRHFHACTHMNEFFVMLSPQDALKTIFQTHEKIAKMCQKHDKIGHLSG